MFVFHQVAEIIHLSVVCFSCISMSENEKCRSSIKSILRIVCKRIIHVINALLKHVTKTVHYVVLNCEGRPLNSFSPFS